MPETNISNARTLTDEQQRVVSHDLSVHAKVTAVAGAGKTTTLIERILFLLDQGVPSHRIGVLMFNKSAQEEFSVRLQQALSVRAPTTLPNVMTFHGFGMRFCRRLEERGLLSAAELKTDEFSYVRLLREARNILLREGDELPNGDESEWLEDFLLFVDQVKASVSEPQSVFEEGSWSSKQAFFVPLYKAAEQRRRQLAWRYFSDLLSDPYATIADAPPHTKAQILGLAPTYEHLLIDEFQDINDCQYELLKVLYGQQSTWMIVGDVQQCIYEWRGAKPSIMAIQFKQDFANITEYQLSQSFRFGHSIGMMATSLLATNAIEQANRDSKTPSPQWVIGAGSDTLVRMAASDRPGKALLTELKQWLSTGGAASDCAVLTRLYSDMVPIQLALMHSNLPYQLHGDSPLLENRQIRLLMAYLAVMAGALSSKAQFYRPDDVEYLLTMPNVVADVKERAAIIRKARQAPHLIPELIDQLAEAQDGWRSKKLHERADWLRMLSSYDRSAGQGLVSTIEKLGIYRYFEHTASKEIQVQEKVATCEAFIAYVNGVGQSAEAILTQLQSLHLQQSDQGIHLMTIHKAKGLEFDFVMLAGLQEGRFPYYDEDLSAIDSVARAQMEAERRLYYVAMTRARKQLALLSAPSKPESNALAKGEIPVMAPGRQGLSRFVFESQTHVIDRLLSHNEADSPIALYSDRGKYLSGYIERAGLAIPVTFKAVNPIKSGQLKAGDKVRHDQYGAGVVIRQEMSGKRMIFVDFEEVGLKRFNPKHTKLVPISTKQ